MFELTSTGHFWLYFVLVFGIIVLPGMDMAFVMASTLVDGRRAGAAAVSGMVVGGMIHVGMSAMGVGLLLMAAPRLFNGLLLLGALYVAWMGWSLWRGATALGEVPAQSSRTQSATFGRAVLTCLLNPKAYVFMLAVFPQFIRVAYGPVLAQTLVLMLITSATQALVYGAVVLAAASLRSWLRGHAAEQVRLGQIVGLLLLAVAVWTVATGWQGIRHTA